MEETSVLNLLNGLKKNIDYQKPYVHYLHEYLLGYYKIFNLKQSDEGVLHIANVINNGEQTPRITWSLDLVTMLFSEKDFLTAGKILGYIETELLKPEFDNDIYLHKKRLAHYKNFLNNVNQ
jgi:hypothetical protein